jgi:hypothetical protein
LRSKWAAGKARGGRIPHHFTLLQIWFSPADIKMVRDGRFARALKNSQLTSGDMTSICETVH